MKTGSLVMKINGYYHTVSTPTSYTLGSSEAATGSNVTTQSTANYGSNYFTFMRSEKDCPERNFRSSCPLMSLRKL